MAAQCKEHICQQGYRYDVFYRVNSKHQKIASEIEFDMHIAILASSNGHILLSPDKNPGIEDAVYEIGISDIIYRQISVFSFFHCLHQINLLPSATLQPPNLQFCHA